MCEAGSQERTGKGWDTDISILGGVHDQTGQNPDQVWSCSWPCFGQEVGLGKSWGPFLQMNLWPFGLWAQKPPRCFSAPSHNSGTWRAFSCFTFSAGDLLSQTWTLWGSICFWAEGAKDEFCRTFRQAGEADLGWFPFSPGKSVQLEACKEMGKGSPKLMIHFVD